jgi:hypothetical protein
MSESWREWARNWLQKETVGQTRPLLGVADIDVGSFAAHLLKIDG